MIGRYHLRRSDGWFLLLAGARDLYIEEPAPPDSATSFFGRAQAIQAAERYNLKGKKQVLAERGFKTVEEMRAAGDDTPFWEIVPDEND